MANTPAELTLTVSISTPVGDTTRTRWHVGWGMHSGPGEVVFSERKIALVRPDLATADSLARARRQDQRDQQADPDAPQAVEPEKPAGPTPPVPTMATTTATFSEPGEYLIRVQAIESPGSFEFHCCWTNGFVKVTVTPT